MREPTTSSFETANRGSPRRGGLASLLWLAVVLGGALALGWLLDGQHFADMFEQAARLDVWVVLVGIVLSLLNYGGRFLRWQQFLGAQGWVIPRLRHLLIYTAGFALTMTPAKAGELVRHGWLRQHGVPMTATAAVLAAERLLDVVVLALLALFVVASTTQFAGWGGVLVAVCGLAMALLVLAPRGLPLVRPFLQGMPRLDTLLATVGEALSVLTPGMLLSGLLLGAAAWACEGAALWLILHNLLPGAAPQLLAVLGIYGLSLIAGAVSLLPGGVGAAEVTLSAGLIWLGVDTQTAIVAALVCRLITLWFGIAVGFAAAAWLGWPGRRADV